MDIPIITRLDRVLRAAADASRGGQRGNYSSIAKSLGGVAGIHLEQCLQHLSSNGYLHHLPPDTTVHRNEDYWVITIAGERLLADGGLKAHQRRKQWSNAFVVAKTVATVLYSLAVLAVAIWAVFVEMGQSH